MKLDNIVFRSRPYDFSNLMSAIYPDEDKQAVSNVTFQVTEDCNLACTYCYQQHKSKKVMSFNTAKKFVDLLLADDTAVNNYINKEKSNGVILEFIGGEPLLQIDLIDQIMDYFTRRVFELDHPWKDRYKCSISTNGILYNTKKVQDFINKHEGHLSLSITLDGCKALHDSCRLFPDGSPSYDIVEAAIKDQMKRFGYSGSKITLCPENIDYLPEAIQNLLDLGFWEINANCVFENVWHIEDAQKLYRKLKEVADILLDREDTNMLIFSPFSRTKYTAIPPEETGNFCGGTGKMLACNTEGKLYPCLRYMESSIGYDRDPMIIGDVDNGIAVSKAHLDIVNCLQCITRQSQSTEECINCPIASGCSWCSAYNYEVFGTANKRATFICDCHKAMALANVYYWNKLYKKYNIDEKFEMHCPKDWALKIIDENEYQMLLDLSNSTLTED